MTQKRLGIILSFFLLLSASCTKEERTEITLHPYPFELSQDAAVSALTSMTTSGYMKKMLDGNIASWATKALADNPNIVEQIALKDTVQLWQIIKNNVGWHLFFSMDDAHGYDGGRSMAVTLKKVGDFGDTDLSVAAAPDYVGDWSEAEQLWFYVDASDFGSDGAKIGIAFQENMVTADGTITSNQQSFRMVSGVTCYLYDENGSSSWVETKSAEYPNNARIALPVGFRGWVAVPLSAKAYEWYWSRNGEKTRMTLKNVNQFQFTLVGDSSAEGKTAYFSEFMIVSRTKEPDELPVSAMNNKLNTGSVVISMDKISRSRYEGTVVEWYDEFAGKLLTGLAYEYISDPCEDLYKAGSTLADALVVAQHPDGYLGVYPEVNRFGGNGRNWDLWGHYHSIYGLLAWYHVTGRRIYFDCARKALDLIYDTFVDKNVAFDTAGWQTMNLAISHAFSRMYADTKDDRYLKAAEKIIEEDWPKSGNWLNETLEGKEYYQSTLPRWEALHTICTLGDLYTFTGNKKYYDAIVAIWKSIAKTDVHNNGGFTTEEQAVGNPYGKGPIETCCTVAWTALSTTVLSLSKDPAVADALELSYFNSIFGSLLDGEKYTTYNTPMEGGKRVASQVDIAFQYNSGSPDFNCCQANIARGLGQVSQWAVMKDTHTMFINFYGEGTITAKTPAGGSIVIEETTEYPKSGIISLYVSSLEYEEDFAIALRIPAWAKNANIMVGDKTEAVEGGQYYVVSGTIYEGLIIELVLDMPVHFWSHENLTSVYYGPILLASENQLDGSLPSSSFERAYASFPQDDKHWLSFKVTDGSKMYTLYDFASIGKFSPYITWLKLADTPE